VDDRRSRGAEGGNCKRHRQPVIVPSIDFATFQAPAPGDVKAIGKLLNLATHPPETVGQGRDTVTFLDAEFGGAADTQLPTMCRESSEHGQFVDDATITSKVKTAFATDKTVSAMDVKVDTNNGNVRLSGFVDSEAEKRKAEEIARSVSGVRSVTNALTVQGEAARRY